VTLIGKIFLGILCLSFLIAFIITFLCFLYGAKDVMQDPDLEIYAKMTYVVLILVSLAATVGWIIASMYMLEVIR